MNNKSESNNNALAILQKVDLKTFMRHVQPQQMEQLDLIKLASTIDKLIQNKEEE